MVILWGWASRMIPRHVRDKRKRRVLGSLGRGDSGKRVPGGYWGGGGGYDTFKW